MSTIVHVGGARPNYVKVAPLWPALATRAPHITQRLVDTGQHHHDAMAGALRRDLALPIPDWSLEVGSGTRAEQIDTVPGLSLTAASGESLVRT
jgi:UDP-N-acetylglucosamine 2-epimerase (non-hydrolysing)